MKAIIVGGACPSRVNNPPSQAPSAAPSIVREAWGEMGCCEAGPKDGSHVVRQEQDGTDIIGVSRGQACPLLASRFSQIQ